MTSLPLPSRRYLALTAAVLFVGLGASGCIRLNRGGKSKTAAAPVATPVSPNHPYGPPPAPAPHSVKFASEYRIGTVRLVGRGGKFVLVETMNGGLLPLPDGQEMHTRTNGEPGAPLTADLRLSRERRQPFVAADVVDGQAIIGDAVFVGGAAGNSPPPLQPTITTSGLMGPPLLPAGTGGLLPAPPPAGGR